MFIKLTNLNGFETPKKFYIKIDLIELFYREKDYTILDLNNERYTVKETPEQILNLIKENKDVW